MGLKHNAPVDLAELKAEWFRIRREIDELARVEGLPGPSELQLLKALSLVEDRLGPSRYLALEAEHKSLCEQRGIPYKPVVFHAKPRKLLERSGRVVLAAVGLLLLLLCASTILSGSYRNRDNPNGVFFLIGGIVAILAIPECVLVLKRKGR